MAEGFGEGGGGFGEPGVAVGGGGFGEAEAEAGVAGGFFGGLVEEGLGVGPAFLLVGFLAWGGLGLGGEREEEGQEEGEKESGNSEGGTRKFGSALLRNGGGALLLEAAGTDCRWKRQPRRF